MRSFEKSFEAQASAPVQARMVSVADAAYGARGRHHFAFEIVLDEVSNLTCFTAEYLKSSRQAKPSFALRLEQGGAAEAVEHTVAVVRTIIPKTLTLILPLTLTLSRSYG